MTMTETPVGETVRTFTIIDPRGVTAAQQNGPVAPSSPGSLAGKKVAIVTHGHWRSWTYFRDSLETYLSAPERGVAHQRWEDERPYLSERYDEIAREADVAVVGLGNCGSCTASVATAAAELASRGMTVTVVATAGFRTLAEKTVGFRGQAQVPVVALPAAYEVMGEDEIIRIADERVGDIEAALTGQNVS